MKTIDRKQFLNKVQSVLGKEIKFNQYGNIYANDNDPENFTQIEFIPQSKKYFFTVYAQTSIGGMFNEKQHDELVEYLRNLNLDKKIVLDTECKSTVI